MKQIEGSSPVGWKIAIYLGEPQLTVSGCIVIASSHEEGSGPGALVKDWLFNQSISVLLLRPVNFVKFYLIKARPSH